MSKLEAVSFLQSDMHMRPHFEEVRTNILESLEADPEAFMSPLTDGKGKPLIDGDKEAEVIFRHGITKTWRNHIEVEGEERLAGRALDFTDSKKIHVLCDIIDGTDLLIRGLSNWCSAIVSFDPSESRVISAFVMLNSGDKAYLYSANYARKQALRYKYQDITFRENIKHKVMNMEEEITLSEVESSKRLDQATICAYGQKIKNMVITSKVLSTESAEEINSGGSAARFYNLAGNPMMCRILDGAVDIVFDVCGQDPHDVVPGAYIALNGGAHMFDLRENPIRGDRTMGIEDLTHFLYKPNSQENKMKYVLAANKELGERMVELTLEAGV